MTTSPTFPGDPMEGTLLLTLGLALWAGLWWLHILETQDDD